MVLANKKGFLGCTPFERPIAISLSGSVSTWPEKGKVSFSPLGGKHILINNLNFTGNSKSENANLNCCSNKAQRCFSHRCLEK